MSVKEAYSSIKSILPENVTLVAVSKTKPTEMIKELYDQGQRIFGENRVQELMDKHDQLPDDIQWHLIGHLQRNKVKYIAPYVSMIHSVDSQRLLKEVNKQGRKNDRVIDCLLQFHIAEEESKYGLSLEEGRSILSGEGYAGYEHIRVCGVMGMATFTDDTEKVKSEFLRLKDIFTILKEEFFRNEDSFSEISMGMSGDYELAIECGSTMVRVGSLIFGERN